MSGTAKKDPLCSGSFLLYYLLCPDGAVFSGADFKMKFRNTHVDLGHDADTWVNIDGAVAVVAEAVFLLVHGARGELSGFDAV
mgnify:CR=1 FL=1